MSLWSSFRDAIVIGRKDDEALYAQALQEIEAGIRRHGLWAKALANAEGNEDRAKAEYIKLVVKDLRDQRYVEVRIQGAIRGEAHRAEEQRQLEIQEQQRILAEQERAAQLQRISVLKSRARNWGFLATIPSWLLGVAFFMGIMGDEFAISALMSAFLFAPIGGFLVYLAAAAVKLSGEWRPDKEKDWGWVWISIVHKQVSKPEATAVKEIPPAPKPAES